MSTNNLPDVSVIEKATLRGIGNAIREKTKGTSEIPVPDMAAVIKSIKSEPKLEVQIKTESEPFKIGEERTVSFIPSEGYDGLSSASVTFIAQAGDAMKTTLSVTPTAGSQIISANNEYGYYTKVLVGPVPLEEKTVTPTTAVQVFTPSEGKLGFSKFTVNAAEGGGGGGEELQSVMEVSF